jgi:hypothetical protein
MAARKSELIQYKVRASFGEAGIDQFVAFLWARTKKQALETVREIAPGISSVVEVKPIDKLTADPGHAVEPATGGAAVGRAPAAPRFFADRRP